MKSVLLLILVAVALGAFWGVSATWAELGPLADPPPGLGIGEATAVAAGPRPKVVVVNGETHAFGTMERDSKLSHAFVFRNDGEAPLKLIKRDTSCKCTISNLRNNALAPGQSTEVVLEWTANTPHSDMRQTAMIETNDPRRQFITLTIEGRITVSHKVEPDELVITNISANQPTSQEIAVYAFHQPQIKIQSATFTEPSTAEYFEFRSLPLPPERLGSTPDAKSGALGIVTIKPGLPLGDIQQTIRLTLDLPGNPTVDVPISGRVTGDVEVLGVQQWNAETGVLHLGQVKRDEGKTTKRLFLVARGEQRDALAPKVVFADPDFLKIRFAEPIPMPDEQQTRYPFTVEVPAGAPVVDHSGTVHGKLGRIDIETSDPRNKRIQMRVRLVVEP